MALKRSILEQEALSILAPEDGVVIGKTVISLEGGESAFTKPRVVKSILKTSRRPISTPAKRTVLDQAAELFLFFGISFLLVCSVVLYFYQLRVSTPLKPGGTLRSGGYISPCGMLADSPICSNTSILHLTEGGNLTLRKKSPPRMKAKKIGSGKAGELSVRVCACVWVFTNRIPWHYITGDDLTISKNGEVYIGKQRITISADLVPFPFDEGVAFETIRSSTLKNALKSAALVIIGGAALSLIVNPATISGFALGAELTLTKILGATIRGIGKLTSALAAALQQAEVVVLKVGEFVVNLIGKIGT